MHLRSTRYKRRRRELPSLRIEQETPVSSLICGIVKAEPLEPTPISYQEPSGIEESKETRNVSNCRCCFKLIDHESQVELPDSRIILQSFEEMLQSTVESSPYTLNFCVECYNTIGSFTQFKNLALLRQEKFRKLRASNSSDFTRLFFFDMEFSATE